MHEKGAFASIKNAFAICLCDSAISIFETQGLVAAVIEEAQLNAQNFTFSYFYIFHRLSHTTCQQRFVPSEEWDSLEKMFNCTLVK